MCHSLTKWELPCPSPDMTKEATLKSIKRTWRFIQIHLGRNPLGTSFHPFAHFWTGTMLREDVTSEYHMVTSSISRPNDVLFQPKSSTIVGQSLAVQSVDPSTKRFTYVWFFWTIFFMYNRDMHPVLNSWTHFANPSSVIIVGSFAGLHRSYLLPLKIEHHKMFVQVRRYLSVNDPRWFIAFDCFTGWTNPFSLLLPLHQMIKTSVSNFDF